MAHRNTTRLTTLMNRVARRAVLAWMLGSGMGGTYAQSPAPVIAPEQRQAFEQLIREYLLNNPQIVIEAQQALQAREQGAKEERLKLALSSSRDALYNDPDSPVGGNSKGDVTVVEFFDYRCGFCKRVAGTVAERVARDPNVRVIYKEFPILGPNSIYATSAALAAHRQGKYVAMHKALMESSVIDEVAVKKMAQQTGLDTQRLLADMHDPAMLRVTDKTFQLAQVLGINGTPGFVIGERVLPGAVDIDALLAVVAAERKRVATASDRARSGS